MGCFKASKGSKPSDENDDSKRTSPTHLTAKTAAVGWKNSSPSKAPAMVKKESRQRDPNCVKSSKSCQKWEDDEENYEGHTAICHSAPITVGTGEGGWDYRCSGPILKSNGEAFGGTPLPLPLPDIINRAESRSASSSYSSRPSVICQERSRYAASSTMNVNHRNSLRAHGQGSWTPYASEPRPLPPPKEFERTGAPLLCFSWEELAGACQNFSPDFWCRDGGSGPVYRASLSLDGAASKTDVDITRIQSSKSVRKWETQFKWMARLQHPHICRVIGFYADAKNNSRAVVYASMPHGCSLDGLLYGRKRDKPPLDWPSRLKIAFGAARGLAFLHDISPSQVAYRCFQTVNVQVDKHFNAKLSDYCFATSSGGGREGERLPYLAPETVTEREASAKSNVWSFGVVLLELMTGRQNMDALFPVEEQNLTEFVRRSVGEERKMYLVMDPELKGFYPAKMASCLAQLALRCVEHNPMHRPSMRHVADILESLRDTNPRRQILMRSVSVKDGVHMMSGRASWASSMPSCLSLADSMRISLTNFSLSSKSIH